jgi:hypothetical protein
MSLEQTEIENLKKAQLEDRLQYYQLKDFPGI